MENEQVKKIIIYSRGKNRDEYGNPYLAWRAIIKLKAPIWYDVIVQKSAEWGSSGKNDCLTEALSGISRALGIEIHSDDSRIEHHHKTVYRMEDLERPENWKIDIYK